MTNASLQSRCYTDNHFQPDLITSKKFFQQCTFKAVRNMLRRFGTVLMLTVMQKEMGLILPELQKKVKSAKH